MKAPRGILALALVVSAAAPLFSCARSTEDAPERRREGRMLGAEEGADDAAHGGDAHGMAGSGGDPGIDWTVPEGWRSQPGSAMRVATYAIPAAGGDREGARCAVFYFGPGQGGGVEENIARWAGEFESPGGPERSVTMVAGVTVTRVRVRGTYLAHAGTGGEEAPARDHALLGAIVEGPRGSVFFKLTGPARSVEAAAADFTRMLDSVKSKP